jgi:hypothetical protein
MKTEQIYKLHAEARKFFNWNSYSRQDQNKEYFKIIERKATRRFDRVSQ